MVRARLALVLGLVIVTAELSACMNELLEVLRGLGTLQPTTHYELMASYSGKAVNDLGDYFSCCKLKGARYALFSLTVSYTQVAMGFCGPESCAAEDYYEIMANLTNADVELNHFASNLAALQNTRSPLRLQQSTPPLAIAFPQTYIHDHFTNLSAGAIVIIIFCGLLLSAAIAGSVLDYMRQHTIAQPKGDYELMEREKVVNSSSTALLPTPLYERILTCFSIYTNLPKLFSSRASEKVGQRSDPLDILNGVRVMSMGWVILGHVYVFRLELGLMKNVDDLTDVFKQVKTCIIYGGFWAVDSFFWLSGLLMSFLLMQTLTSKGKLSPGGWLYMYGHRFYRILPAYMFVMFLTWALLKYSGNGPLWINGDSFNNPCHDYWWTNLLFINNFVPSSGQTCLAQSWYLANDMQFFLISPPIFFLYHHVARLLGWLSVLALCICTVLSATLISNAHDFNVVLFAREDTSFMNDYYTKPYCRVAPYAIGIATGLILFSYRHYRKTNQVYDRFALMLGKGLDNRVIRYCSYALGLFLINFFIFIQYNAYKDVDNGWTSWSKADNLMFLGWNRLCWGLGLSLVLLPMLLGHNRVATWFLAHSIWTPLARLTFCTYLVHLSLLYSYYLSQNTAYWLNDLSIGVDLVFVTVVSYLAAVPLTLLMESPFMALEKLLKGK